MAEVKTRRPASQYYWGDWWKDKALHSCSQPARGLWHEMNCLQHEGEPYGHLTLNNQPMTPAQLANLCRISTARCAQLLDELESAGVFSRSENGAIYSRRMVRDEKTRNARAEGGKAGAEHGVKGAEHGSKGGRPKHDKGGQETPLTGDKKPSPSSASSSSSSTSVKENPSGSTPDKPAKPARGSKRVPADFSVTDAMRTWAVTEAPHADLERETAKFRDWEFAHARTDWPATWRTWLRKASDNALEKRGKTGSAPFQTDRQRRMAEAVPGLASYRSRTADDERTIDMEASHGALT